MQVLPQVLITESESSQSGFRTTDAATFRKPPGGRGGNSAQEAFDKLREYAIQNLCASVKAQQSGGDHNCIRALVSAITTR